MPIAGQQAVQPVSAGASLVAEADPAVLIAQPSRQLAQYLGPVLKNAELADLAASAALGNRHRHRRLVHIQSNVRDRVHPARLPCMRLCAGHPTQPSTSCTSRAGPPITQRTWGLADMRVVPQTSFSIRSSLRTFREKSVFLLR